MKKINFSKLKVEVSIDQFQEIDVRYDIGNALYQQARELAVDDLSRKIAHSPETGVILDDDEYSLMMQTLEPLLAYRMKKAIVRAVEEIATPKK